MDDRIEQEIRISASVDRVWDLVTRPGWWVPGDDEVPPDRAPGARTVRESEKWGRFAVEVVELTPKTYAAFRWASAFPGDDLAPGRTTLVEFFVRPAGQEVSVTVVESGFAALELPEARRAEELTGNTGGWQEEMASLKSRSEQP